MRKDAITAFAVGVGRSTKRLRRHGKCCHDTTGPRRTHKNDGKLVLLQGDILVRKPDCHQSVHRQADFTPENTGYADVIHALVNKTELLR